MTSLYAQIITSLLSFVTYQQRIITLLMAIILGKSIARRLHNEPIDKPYRKLVLDQIPIIEVLENSITVSF